MNDVRHFTVKEDEDGQRLDRWLKQTLPRTPYALLQKMVRTGQVRIDGKRAKTDTRLMAGQDIRLPPAEERTIRLSFDAKPNDKQYLEAITLYDDGEILILNKPYGLPVQGGPNIRRHIDGMLETMRNLKGVRPRLVHRLDRETSGILLVAKKRSALTRLQDQFRDRETGKTYLALVTGAWPANKKVIDQPLHKYLQADGERRVKVVAKDDPDGMRSVTLVKVSERLLLPPPPGEGGGGGAAGGREATLLEVTIKTGRTHQIRVHLASAGHPIAGDDKYGDFELNKALQKQGLKRMFLHAWRLQFDHPATGERIALQDPLPAELHRFTDHARQPTPPVRPDRL